MQQIIVAVVTAVILFFYHAWLLQQWDAGRYWIFPVALAIPVYVGWQLDPVGREQVKNNVRALHAKLRRRLQ